MATVPSHSPPTLEYAPRLFNATWLRLVIILVLFRSLLELTQWSLDLAVAGQTFTNYCAYYAHRYTGIARIEAFTSLCTSRLLHPLIELLLVVASILFLFNSRRGERVLRWTTWLWFSYVAWETFARLTDNILDRYAGIFLHELAREYEPAWLIVLNNTSVFFENSLLPLVLLWQLNTARERGWRLAGRGITRWTALAIALFPIARIAFYTRHHYTFLEDWHALTMEWHTLGSLNWFQFTMYSHFVNWFMILLLLISAAMMLCRWRAGLWISIGWALWMVGSTAYVSSLQFRNSLPMHGAASLVNQAWTVTLFANSFIVRTTFWQALLIALTLPSVRGYFRSEVRYRG